MFVFQWCSICDVIWENKAYGRIKRTGSDQMPYVLHGIWSEPGLFVTCEHLQETLFSLSAQFKNNYVYMEKADLRKHCEVMVWLFVFQWHSAYTVAASSISSGWPCSITLWRTTYSPTTSNCVSYNMFLALLTVQQTTLLTPTPSKVYNLSKL